MATSFVIDDPAGTLAIDEGAIYLDAEYRLGLLAYAGESIFVLYVPVLV